MKKPTDDKHASDIHKALEKIAGRIEANVESSRKSALLKSSRQFSASPHTTDRIQVRDLQPINDNELKSVYALLAYVAHNENIRQETVQAIVEANFNVNHIAKIQHKDYEEVIRFLVDLRIDEMRN